jgi:hypothetical protein
MRIRPEAVLVAAALLAAAPAAEAQQWRTVTSARQHQGERALEVRVQYGAGDLRVAPAPGGLLYRMELRHDERQTRLLSEYDRAAGRLRLGAEALRRNQRGQRGGSAAIELSPRVATDLRLEFGAGRAELELGGLAVRSLELATGASETELAWSSPNRVAAGEVRLASGASRLRASGLGNARAERIRYEGAWSRSAELSVQMGLGAVTLRFPRSLGVRIESRSTLSRFSPEGMERRGDAWYSAGWDRAQHRLTVRVDAALGAVNVQWLD